MFQEHDAECHESYAVESKVLVSQELPFTKFQGKLALTFTPPESTPSGQFWCIYALIGEVRVKE